jgi:hypothetical protein
MEGRWDDRKEQMEGYREKNVSSPKTQFFNYHNGIYKPLISHGWDMDDFINHPGRKGKKGKKGKFTTWKSAQNSK